MALLAVLLLSTVGLVFVAIGQRYVSATLTTEEAHLANELFGEGAVEAAVVAIEKFERSMPTKKDYECMITLPTSQGERVYYIEYVRLGDGVWEINVEPYSRNKHKHKLDELPEILP